MNRPRPTGEEQMLRVTYAYECTMRLIAMGERRNELSLVEAWEAYRQRYDAAPVGTVFARGGRQDRLAEWCSAGLANYSADWDTGRATQTPR